MFDIGDIFALIGIIAAGMTLGILGVLVIGGIFYAIFVWPTKTSVTVIKNRKKITKSRLARMADPTPDAKLDSWERALLYGRSGQTAANFEWFANSEDPQYTQTVTKMVNSI